MNRIQELAELGQSIWYDNIRRALLDDGGLAALVEAGVTGVTSNPSIYEKAIAGSADYDDALGELALTDMPVTELYETLALEDIQRAADILRPVYDRTGGVDGYVSLEVSPSLAHDTEATIAEARRLYAALDRANVLIKVPATPAGIPAIETLIGEGININVTLMFSLDHYDAVAGAYIAGLEKLAASGRDLSKAASVASFFVSRVDSLVDRALEEVGNEELQGKIAIANAKAAYARFHEVFQRRAVGAAGSPGGARPASSVGQHQHQEPALPGHPVRGRAHRAGHGQHGAASYRRRLSGSRHGNAVAGSGPGRGARPTGPPG